MLKRAVSTIFIATLLFTGACKKKQPPAPPPPPPPPVVKAAPAAPVIDTFSATPLTITRGQASTLRWEVRNATEVNIEGVGQVSATSGSRDVYPTQTTTYRLSAKGAGGGTEASVRVTVNIPEAPPPPPPPPPPAQPKASFAERMGTEVQDIFFDYDQQEVREDARATLQRNADAIKQILKDFPSATISIEGHCDERGSAEYNLGLGDRRATAAREFLTQIGVPADRLSTISYGKERQQCTEQSESCWQKNRRAHFAAK
jgi:peptidoglycan-associated lipoprotein